MSRPGGRSSAFRARADDAAGEAPGEANERRHRMRRAGAALGAIIGIYLFAAYLLLPLVWERHEEGLRRASGVSEPLPRITHTRDGIPGDPVNVAIVGDEGDLHRAMRAAGWHPADPITLRSSIRIAVETVIDRPYEDAPVSDLFLFGRIQDLAFEKPVGDAPRRRHHVRFWRCPEGLLADAPTFLGAATFDKGVGLSDRTGEVTHHIAEDVDSERDLLARDLDATGWVAALRTVPDFHVIRSGRNGGGDPWRTDGALRIVELRPDGPGSETAKP